MLGTYLVLNVSVTFNLLPVTKLYTSYKKLQLVYVYLPKFIMLSKIIMLHVKRHIACTTAWIKETRFTKLSGYYVTCISAHVTLVICSKYLYLLNGTAVLRVYATLSCQTVICFNNKVVSIRIQAHSTSSFNNNSR